MVHSQLVMIKLHKMIINNDLEVKILLQVHDELVFEINESKIDSSIDKIKNVMENTHLEFKTFEVPLLVDYGFGNNWRDAH